jgi:hypothetical protein
MKNDKLIKRLKIIEGQVRGLQEMVHSGVYCIDIITQTHHHSDFCGQTSALGRGRCSHGEPSEPLHIGPGEERQREKGDGGNIESL